MTDQLSFSGIHLAPLFLFNLISLACSISTLVFLLKKEILVLARLCFVFAFLLVVFFQAPSVIFANQLEQHVSNHWQYSISLNLLILLLFVYGYFTLDLGPSKKDLASHPLSTLRAPSKFFYVFTFGLAALLLSVYYSDVPWKCTGLFAFFFDPNATLLAREYCAKIAPSSWSGYSIGTYIASIAPLLSFLLVVRLISSLIRRRYYQVMPIVALLGIIIATIMVAGSKGSLVPMALFLAVSFYICYWGRGAIRSLATIFGVLAILMLFLASFEVIREGGAYKSVEPYNLAVCARDAGHCPQAKQLLVSLLERDSSLGLSRSYVLKSIRHLECVCSNQSECEPPPIATSAQPRLASLANERVAAYSNGIFNRIFVVPFQVSTWHYSYAATESFPVREALPFAKKLYGKSINMPELVYQKYGVVYSNGDKTITSTAPTTFAIAYPAYFGPVGFLASFILVILLDFLYVALAAKGNRFALATLCGMVSVSALNLISSDFLTSLISHGILANILLLKVASLSLGLKSYDSNLPDRAR